LRYTDIRSAGGKKLHHGFPVCIAVLARAVAFDGFGRFRCLRAVQDAAIARQADE
jgi:hypothetical protein